MNNVTKTHCAYQFFDARKSYFFQQLLLGFSSPVFLVVAVFFNLFCAFNFFILQSFFSATGRTDLHYFFTIIPYICTIVFPVLCFNLQNLTIKSAPFSSFCCVFSFFLVVLIQFLAFSVFLIFIVLCVNFFGDIDIPSFFASSILIVFYASSAISLCIFFMNFFENYIFSLFFSVLALAFTNSIHILSRFLSTSSVLNVPIKFFSLAWHFQSAAKGVLDSRDIVYFLLFTVFFLFLTVFSIELKKGFVLSKSQKTNFSWILLIFILLFLNSSKYFFKQDLSRHKKNSLSVYSKNILSEIDAPLSITYYKSKSLSSLYPATRDIFDFLQEFSAVSKNASVLCVDPEKVGVVENLKNYGVVSRQIQTSSNNKMQFENVYSSIVIEYMGKIEVVPFILNAQNLEYEMTRRILHLLNEKERFVNILCANGLSLKNDYTYLIPYLSSQGFLCNEIRFFQNDFNENNLNLYDELKNAKDYGNILLVLGQSSLSKDDVEAIVDYLQSGKKAFFALSQYNCDIDGTWNVTKPENQNLIEMLESLGINFSKDLICDLSSARITMQSEDGEIKKMMNYYEWPCLLPQENAKQGMTVFWPTELIFFENENIFPMLFTSSSSCFSKIDEKSEKSLFLIDPFIMEEKGFNFEKDFLSSKCVCLYYKNKKNNMEFELLSDQYFVHSSALGFIGGEYGDYRNLDFLVNRLLCLNDEKELASLQEKNLGTNNYLYKISNDYDFANAKRKTYFVVFVLVPLVIIAFWCVCVAKRRNFYGRWCK